MNRLTSHLIRTCLLVILALSLSGFGHCASVTAEEAKQLRDEVKEMFYHAFDGYMKYAFPLDELRPKSCTGEDTLGGYSLTLIDSLDTLALFADRERFSSAVEWLGNNLHFRKNKTVSVFETTIRILGGLLSAHLLASDDATGMRVYSYNNELLHLAEDLARRMLPAFETPTGIPYGSVNLLFGVDEHESKITSTAGGGTLTLEFGLLSRLTGDPVFENVTKNAVRGLWSQRSELNLVGAHINVFTGYWTQKDAGIGTSIDSFYEYLLKAHLLFGDEEYLYMFQEAYRAVMQYIFNDPWYVEVNMNSAAVVWPLFNSLQAFWPGLQALAGDVEPAARTHKAFFQVWKQYGFTPEGFNLATMTVQPGQRSYPLRPELIESTYWLYKATRDPSYLDVGRDILASLQHGARCSCGYCHIADVETHEQEDHMESFFLAETVKYLWLLFDLAMGGENMIEKGPYGYIFSTEGHLFPLKPSISLLPERKAMSQLVDRLNDRKSENRFANYETLLSHLTAMGKKKFNSKHRATKGVCPAISHSRNHGLSSLADDLFTSKKANEQPDDEAYYQDRFDDIKVVIRSFSVDDEGLISLIINDNTSNSMENGGNDDSNETCIPRNKINYTQENSGDSSCKGHYARNETCLADNILNNIIANVEDSFCKVHDESNEPCIQGAPTEDESICKHLPNTNANEEAQKILENR